MGVRGGFDSHAFPPFAGVLAVLLVLVPGTARSQAPPAPSAPDTALVVPAPEDSTEFSRLLESPLDTTATAAAPQERRKPTAGVSSLPKWQQPRWVMFRSLVVPGWGQLHNGSWFKAVGLGGLEIYLIARAFDDGRALDRRLGEASQAQADFDEARYNAVVDAYNQRLAETVNRRWFLGGVIAYALVDAYVDANFRGFDVQFDVDPALPGGAGQPAGGKLSLRWKF